MDIAQQPYFAQPWSNPVTTQQPYRPQNNSNSSSLMTVLVHGEDEVNNYTVAAGFTVMLVDVDMKKFWLKTTGMNGVPQQPRVFSIHEETPTVNTIPTGNYVSKDEFNALNAKLDKLLKDLGGNDNV